MRFIKQFKPFFTAAFMVFLFLAFGVARAGVSVSLSGPTSVGVGQTAEFDVLLKYTPMDLSVFYADLSGNGMADFANRGITYYQAQYGVVSDPLCLTCSWNWQDLDLQPTFYPILSFPLNLNPLAPYERTYSLSTVVNAPGNYSLGINLFYIESVLEFGSELCYSQYGDVCNDLTDQMNFSRDSGAEWHFGVAAIPEPETYAMMLAGLGLLGVVARRRKQKLNA